MINAAVKKFYAECDWTGLVVKSDIFAKERGHVVGYSLNTERDLKVPHNESQPKLAFHVKMNGSSKIKKYSLSHLVEELYEDPSVDWPEKEALIDVEYAGLAIRERKSNKLEVIAKIMLVNQGKHEGRVMFVLRPHGRRYGYKERMCLLRDIKAYFVEHLSNDATALYKVFRKTLPPSAPSSPAKPRRSPAKRKSTRGSKAQKKTSASNAYIGRRVKKWFPNPAGFYHGTVASMSPDLFYRVEYDDGDVEDYSVEELRELLVSQPRKPSAAARRALAKAKSQQKKKSQQKRKAAAAAAHSSESEQDESTDDESAARSNKRSPAKGTRSGGSPAKQTRSSSSPAKRTRVSNTRSPGKNVTIAKAKQLVKAGIRIKKEFAGFGVFEGEAVSADYEAGSRRVLYHIKYQDGDEEDLYHDELCKYWVRD